MSKQAKLDQIRADILGQNICPDLAVGAKQLVFGDGNPDADIVFIGEAPGKREDEQGVPFVGAAGKFLNEMLEMIQLERKDIYITNIVKYRPPDNRDPLPEEKEAFLPFLQKQLEIIQPKIVVTLGRHSMEVLLPPGLRISQVHGEPKRVRANLAGRVGGQRTDGVQGEGEKRTEPYINTVKGVSQSSTQQFAVMADGFAGSAGKSDGQTLVILPLYHPAAALYNGGMRQTLIDDFKRIPEILKKIN